MAIGTPTSLGTPTSNNITGLTTGTLTTSSAIVAGNLVVVFVSPSGNSAPAVSSVSDGTNTYTRALTVSSSFTTNEIWYKENASAVSSGATITVTLTGAPTGAGNNINIAAVQVTGIITSSSLDKTVSANTSTTTPSVTTATLSQANEIAFGFASSTTANVYTEDASFTNLFNWDVAQRSGAGYKTVAATTAITYAPTFTTAPFGIPIVLATFKGSGTTDVNITGVAGTGAVGTPVPSVSRAITGVSGTGAVGTVTAQSSAIAQNITGVSGTGAVGSLVSSVSAFITGTVGTGQTGVLLPSDSPGLVGVAGTGAVGSLRGGVSVFPVGVFGTGLVGSVTTPTQAFITGVSGIGQVGEVYPIPPAPASRPPLFIPSENGLPASLWLGQPNGNLN